MDKTGFLEKQPRRKFLTGFLAAVGGAATALFLPKRARAEAKKQAAQEGGPILYRRTEETEKYYRTLYYR